MIDLSFSYQLAVYAYLALCFLILATHKKSPKTLAGLTPISLVTVGVLLALTIFEAVLATGILDGNLIWSPRRYQQELAAINEEHERRSASNLYKFNDLNHDPVKQAGVFRIAIIGDSFVWGAALPNDQRWTTKFERKLEQAGFATEVLHWGRSGWSTLTELNFLKQHLAEWKIDLLIVGFVTNDPDVGAIPQQMLTWQDSSYLSPLRKLFPESLNFLSAFVNQFIYNHSSDYGYMNWDAKIWQEPNLKRYALVLDELAEFCSVQHVPLLFVLTPNDATDYFRLRYEQLTPYLNLANIKYLDLYPTVKARLDGLAPEDLKAHRADGHPGPKVTEVYADQTVNYVVKHYQLPRRRS